MIEPFKYLLQPIAIERNGTGRIIREISGEVVAVFSAEQAQEAIIEFEAQLAIFDAKQEEKTNGDT